MNKMSKEGKLLTFLTIPRWKIQEIKQKFDWKRHINLPPIILMINFFT